MEKEENVYEKTNQTGHGVDAGGIAEPKVVGGDKDGSTVLGKFKDVDALARAYSSLQAEFTRRSQKLKELEKTLENFEGKDAASGAEKLRKNAAARRDRAKEFEEFVAEVRKGGETLAREEDSVQNVEDVALNADIPPSLDSEPDVLEAPNEEPISADVAEDDAAAKNAKPTGTQGVNEQKHVAAFGDSVKGGTFPTVARNAEDSSEALYTQVSRDEGVRLRIIGEYLSSLGRTTAPVMTSGVGALTTPPLKAKSIGDAGDMALRYFKKSSV